LDAKGTSSRAELSKCRITSHPAAPLYVSLNVPRNVDVYMTAKHLHHDIAHLTSAMLTTMALQDHRGITRAATPSHEGPQLQVISGTIEAQVQTNSAIHFMKTTM